MEHKMSKTSNTSGNKAQLTQLTDLHVDCSSLTNHPSGVQTWNLRQRLFLKLITLASKWLIMILRSLFTPVFRFQEWEGVESNSGQNIRIAYIGDDKNRLYWQDLIYGKVLDATENRTLYWWQLRRTLRETKPKNDISVVDLHYPFTVLFQDDGVMQIPRWVKQHIAIAPCWESVMQGMRRKTRKEAQRIIRKYGFQARITSSNKAAIFFYDRIYSPYVLKRYGATAHLVDRRQFLRECSSGQILELISNGKVVAASMIQQTGRRLAIVWTGIMLDVDGKEHPGASDVLDYFSLRLAHQRGCEFLDLGPSRPSLNDGLLNYKKKWGASLYVGRFPQGLFMVIPNKFSVPVQTMLESAKFITLEKGRLIGNLFIPNNIGFDNIETRIRWHWVDGLDSLRFHFWSMHSETPPRNHHRIEILSLTG